MLIPQQHEPFVDFGQIKKEAFLLLNIGYGLNRLLDDAEGDIASRKNAALFREYGKLYESEICSRLVRVAISSRILDDKLANSSPVATASRFIHEEMLGDTENGESINLRQCFNKIIHATHIDYELQLPEVYLSGKHQNEKECKR